MSFWSISNTLKLMRLLIKHKSKITKIILSLDLWNFCMLNTDFFPLYLFHSTILYTWWFFNGFMKYGVKSHISKENSCSKKEEMIFSLPRGNIITSHLGRWKCPIYLSLGLPEQKYELFNDELWDHEWYLHDTRSRTGQNSICNIYWLPRAIEGKKLVKTFKYIALHC